MIFKMRLKGDLNARRKVGVYRKNGRISNVQ